MRSDLKKNLELVNFTSTTLDKTTPPVDWLQSVLKNTRFENVFFVCFVFLKIRRHVRVGVKLD
jgi:hypothetical protein